MKRIFYITILISYSTISIGQVISSLLPGFNAEVRTLYFDSSSNYLYAGGLFSALNQSSITMNRVSFWNGTNWDSLGSGVNDGGYVTSFCKYNGSLIVGGTFDSIGGISAKGLAQWDGLNWHSFANVYDSQGYGCIQTLFVDGSDLYIGGCFDFINGSPAQGVAKFDGLNWLSYPSIGGTSHSVNAIIKFNNELYIGGNFNAGTGKSDILKFNGIVWESVGGGFSGSLTIVNDLKEFQNKLVVCGYFQVSNGDPGNNIAAWDGTNWSQLDNGLLPSNVFEMHIFNNNLYVGGQINDASGIPVSYIAVWNGVTWSAFDNNILDNGVTSFSSNGNDLYFGGAFLSVNGITMRQVAKYNLSTGINDLFQNCFISFYDEDKYKFVITKSCDEQYMNIYLYNIYGQLIMKDHNIYMKYYDINNFMFQSGIYYIVVISNNVVYSKKLAIY